MFAPLPLWLRRLSMPTWLVFEVRTVHLLARSGFLHVPVAGWSGSDEARRDGGIVPRLNDGEDVEMTFHDTVRNVNDLVTDRMRVQ